MNTSPIIVDCSTAGFVVFIYLSRGVTVLLDAVCERGVVLVSAG